MLRGPSDASTNRLIEVYDLVATEYALAHQQGGTVQQRIIGLGSLDALGRMILPFDVRAGMAEEAHGAHV